MYFEETYHIDSREVDHQGFCRPSALLGYLQVSATAAAIRLHVANPETMVKYNSFWMLARIWVELKRPLRWGEELTVRTWHRPPKGPTIYRDFDLYCGGECVGQAVSTWVLADRDTHRLFRMERVEEFAANAGDGLGKTLRLTRVKLPEGMEEVERRRLYYSELDMNNHVNNTRYADFACDTLRLESLSGGAFVSQLQIGFLAECKAGEELVLYAGQDGEAGLVKGVGPDGKTRFEASVTVTPGPG